MAIKTRADFYKYTTNINTSEIFHTSQLLTNITGQRVQSNKAIIGKNAFAHESGIHQDGILKNRTTYEIMTPESVGIREHEIILGKHSGRSALKNHLTKLGYELTDDELQKVFIEFKAMADKNKNITDQDLDCLMGGGKLKNQHKWQLSNYDFNSKNSQLAIAKLTLKNIKTGQEFSQEKTGTGMVDAAFQCIEEICGKHGELSNYHIDSVDNGLNSQAIVYLDLKTKEGQTSSGKASDTDIIKASILAYLSVIDKIDK
jgi:2-isopropylmalate synthase